MADGRRPMFEAVERVLALVRVATESGEPPALALRAAVDQVAGAGAQFGGPLPAAAVELGEAYIAAAGASSWEPGRLRDAWAGFAAAVVAERSRLSPPPV